MDIAEQIRSTYGGFDEIVTDVINILTMAPESNTAIWGIIKSVFTVVLPVGFSIATAFLIITMIGKATLFKLNNYENIVKLFLVVAIGKMVLENSFELLGMIYQVVADVISSVGINRAKVEDLVEIDSMILAAESMDFIDGLIFKVQQIPVYFISQGIKLAIMAFAYGRMIEIYIYMAMAPIPLATAVSEDYNYIAKKFIQSFAGVCLQGLIMLLACIIFSALSVELINPAADSYLSGGWGFLLASGVLLFAVAKSGGWGKQMAGLA